MASKVRNGYIAPTPKGVNYVVDGVSPSGVFVQHMIGAEVELHYAGEGAGVALGEFHLPNDPKFLRDIAKAITNVAKEIEDSRKPR